MSIDTGIKRGFQYVADYMRCMDVAFKAGVKHPDQIAHLFAACATPATDWLKELAAAGGVDVRGNVTDKLLLSLVLGDPFAGSRKDVQDLKVELGVK